MTIDNTNDPNVAALISVNSSELSEPIHTPATKQQDESADRKETDVVTESQSVKAIEMENSSEKSSETVCLEDITPDNSYRLDWVKKKADACGEGVDLEIYPNKRQMVSTGRTLKGYEHIRRADKELEEIHNAYIASSYNNSNNSDDGIISEPPPPMTAEEVLEHLRKDKNGAKFIQAIESGDISGFDTNDRSRIDFSVVFKLCFYCLNPDVIREILMNSHLRRDKWNTMRGNVTYLDYIIALALHQCTKHYHPSKKNKQGTQL